MVIPNDGGIDGTPSDAVLGQEVPTCTEHRGTCLRCHTEIKVKPRKKFEGQERRQRSTISIRVPNDERENGAGVWDELVDQLRERYGQPDAPPYFVLVKAMYEALTIPSRGIESDPED